MKLTRLFVLAMLLVGLGFLVMTPPSYLRYSAFGLDSEWQQSDTIIHYYFRFRWPGDGTFRSGGGVIHYSIEEEDLDPVDLAGRLFAESDLALHRASRGGFGYWHGQEAYDDKGGTHPWARWISVPAWLPAVTLLGIAIVVSHSTASAKEAASEQTKGE